MPLTLACHEGAFSDGIESFVSKSFLNGMINPSRFLRKNMDENLLLRRLVQSTSYRMQNCEDDMHIMPQDDWFDHLDDVNCPCLPTVDPENQREYKLGQARFEVWVHNRIKHDKDRCQ